MRIRVETPLLRWSADAFELASGQLGHVAFDLIRLTDGAPDYDGQFGLAVRARGAEIASRMQTASARAAELVDELRARAQAFESADREARSRLELLEIGLQALAARFRSPHEVVGGGTDNRRTTLPTMFLQAWSGTRYVQSGGLNLRLDPSLSASVIEVLPNETRLTATGEVMWADGYLWVRVLTSGASGWVAARYLAASRVRFSQQGHPMPVPEGVVPALQLGRVTVTQNFSGQTNTNEHNGIDVACSATVCDPPLWVQASYTGKLVFYWDGGFTNEDNDRKALEDNFAWGNMMIVEYPYDDQPADVQAQWQGLYDMHAGQSLYFQYAHLQTGFEAYLPPGLAVAPGSYLAQVGNSGNSHGPHLHLGAKVGTTGRVWAEAVASDKDPLWNVTGDWYEMEYVDPDGLGVVPREDDATS